MDKELFKKIVEPLGVFKKRFGDDDMIFRSYPVGNLCVVCKDGNTITIEKKWGYKERAYWRYKCVNCKSHWEKK